MLPVAPRVSTPVARRPKVARQAMRAGVGLYGFRGIRLIHCYWGRE